MTTDEIEKLAKAMYESHPADRGKYERSCDKDWWRSLARAAIDHLGERRGIEFEGMSDELLDHLRQEFVAYQDFDNAMACRNEKTRRNELARRAGSEKDEWRGAIAKVLVDFEGDAPGMKLDAILAAIAPLREKSNQTWQSRWDEMVKIADEHRQRAEAAEAELRRIMEAVKHVIGEHGCAADSTTQ